MMTLRRLDRQRSLPPSWTAKRYIRPEAVQRREIGIEVGKDADFLIFDEDLLTAKHEGFSHNMPRDVYFGGKKVN
jgi:predicted amidohydrolase YtcJ